ncbi:membrane protein insertase YidC [Limobrevibacterium gyesilva]|uniref:Membrane protein insertase YidC n=1 Tax=Limobrevibacterium gyesilva TaxID=2991712 RepID=A0AA42CE51_9PROT|nr:membrane protein insertase YidC [Limobrevibacterium gyesilva]MCW3474829.1 membrane protein insertase YidC [Limobrevibacterium gyesilva]
MDQKRLFLAIAISIAILIGFQYLMPRPPHPVPAQDVATTAAPATPGNAPASQPPAGAAVSGAIPAQAAATAVPREVPRLKIAGTRVQGSISLLGARLDDLVLRDYRETIEPNSPLVRLLEPRADPQPYFVQFGWTAAGDAKVAVPTDDTLWSASGELAASKPLTLSWDNGQGQVFELVFSLDDNYMFTVQQRVRNTGAEAVTLYPWSRIRRDYTPVTAGYYILHEGMIGVLDGRLKETKYSDAKSEGAKNNGIALTAAATGGWAGITDKYWLTALVPDQASKQTASFRYIDLPGGSYQVDFLGQEPLVVAPGAAAASSTRLFAGAKEVHLLDRYESQDGIPSFDKAVDFGWFYFLTKPIFYALDWLNHHLHNFGLAILVFTVFVKGLFFPLANKSYRSMSKMKLLGPKMTALREQYKEDPAKLQSAMMALYKGEKVNPASGCLPMLIQIPVFFSLYKVIFVTIEMRQAPFFGWIHDLSSVDPTNVFNLFGLIPFDPAAFSPMLHLGAWPLIMGITMFLQQKLNPPPPDPVQAKVFQFMPVIFTFMLAHFPAGLVIYWSWNNLLTIGQQWLIMRQTSLSKPSLARG